MPMSADILGPLLMAGVDKATAANPEAGPAQRAAMFKEMAAAIILHIQTTAVVNSVVVVASVSGVTTGPGVSGPGAGTAIGTIT